MSAEKKVQQKRYHLYVRLNSLLADKYYGNETLFRSKHYAAEKAAEAYPFIREDILDSLTGRFSGEELVYLLKNLEVEKTSFLTSGDELKNCLDKYFKFLSEDEKKEHGDTYKTLLSKIAEMNDTSIIILTEFILTFINYSQPYKTSKKITPKIKFDRYIKRILPQA